MEHLFDIRVKTLAINALTIIPFLFYFHRNVWPPSLQGGWVLVMNLIPWFMMLFQLMIAETLAGRFHIFRRSTAMVILAVLLSAGNVVFSWQAYMSVVFS
ncbi:hypothetical protein [Erwinia typographi]|uniref:hypothetical protein n=1 Tax=Erwinia typographi TaxID=371042 RepID=UPI000A796B8F|nr:hypothetical protein [Erwinia typographi]